MKKNFIKILSILALTTSLVACNEIQTTSTIEELNNIYFLTDKDYTYDEIIEWAIENDDVKSSTLMATVFTLDCDKVYDYQICVDFVYSPNFGLVGLQWDTPDDEVKSSIRNFSTQNPYNKNVIGEYNAYLNKDVPYTISFGFKERYVLNNIKFEKGKHYVVFCGTIDNLLHIESHKYENKIHNGQNVIN